MTDTEDFWLEFEPLDGSLIDPAPPVAARKTARNIIAEVATEHKVRAAEMLGPRRWGYLIKPRHEAMKRIRDELGYSYPLIGRIFGRDHVTVIWACRGGRKNQPSRAKLREIAA
jgi:chromosomal replication initiation ATPase DnaA